MQVNAQLKKLAFHQEKIAAAMKKSTAAALNKIGAYVRTRAQTSMRYSNKSAPAGQPPRAHRSNPMLRKLIFFAISSNGKSVDVGPVPYRKGRVPQLQERGGRTTIMDHGKPKIITIKPHPFMGPALEKEAPAFPSYWKGTVEE